MVKPVSESFDNGERPINIDASNVIWLSNKETNWIGKDSEAKLSFLWDDGESIGTFVKLSKGFRGNIVTDGTVVHV